VAEIKLTPAQQAVVDNRGGSLLVSAAAGSGKTKVLVERLFRYITEEHRDVNEFLIITYTKAAAAELRSKIAAELAERIAREPRDQHLRRQLLLVYQADIKTVDAFCTRLLRENTHLLVREDDRHGLSPDFRVLDENEAKLLRERVLLRTLDDFYAHLDAGGEELADTLGFGRDDRTLTELVLELYEKLQSHAYPLRWLAENRACWERMDGTPFGETAYAKTLLLGVRRKAAFRADLLRGALDWMADCPPLEKGYAAPFGVAAETLSALAAAAETGDWETARTAVKAVTFPRLGQVKDADGGSDKLRAKKLWDDSKAALKPIAALLDVSGEEAGADLTAVAPAMLALLALTGSFSEAYRAEKLRQNAADFSDQEHLALQILTAEDGTPTELGEQIAARYQEILVDEYQDTNEVQNAIFRAVSKEGRNLFTVGDVKQSIYRFRLADPTIFLRKYERFKSYTDAQEGEERKILLSQNFRSRQEILDATNFVFENILSPEMGEMVYGNDEALHFGASYYPERHDCDTEFHLIRARQHGEEDDPVKRLTAEARFAAQRIRELLDSGYPVTDGGALRPCRPEDIVILMRSPGSRSAAYAAALAEREIPCSFEESGDFFAAMEVSDLFSLLEIIDNPRQDVPLVAVLRSPVFGFTPDRMAEIRGGAPEGCFYDALSADGGEDCRRFLETLNALRLAAQDMSVPRLLWHIYNQLNVLGVYGAMDRGAERRENLIALAAHAERMEGSGYCGVFAFVTQLRRLIESGRAPATRGASDSAGVRLMSIHRSKGLEFPIVLLCDLDHAFSRQDFNSPVLVHPALGLGPQRVELARKIKYPTMARRALEETLLRENKSEEQRILYVAMTRAKEKLILIDAMYHAETRLAKLLPMASCPVLPEAVGGGKCFADWLLLALLCRPEAKPLRELAGMEAERLYTGDTAPWQVTLHDAEEFRALPARPQTEQAADTVRAAFDPALLDFRYPYEGETALPAKLTATQLKGREADEEIAEQTASAPRLRPLCQPRFRQSRAGLTPAEAGTANHLVLQFLDFSDRDVAGQVERLRQKHLLTDEQAAAVQIRNLERFFNSPMADAMRASPEVLREYRFTVLVDAAAYDPAAAGDSILLQGIVDCCFREPDGSMTVLDFKTDKVTGDGVRERAEHYRPQLEAYTAALTRVLERPVRRKVLYFLHTGEAVELTDSGFAGQIREKTTK
jgi:ATP-dependent helicase/nuclease subunit A